MKATQWKRKIVRQCKALGTYDVSYSGAVSTLADLLERRDEAYEQFKTEGSHATIQRTSDRGAVNQVINPVLKLWQDLNRDALAYWRDLGLTPAGYKRLNLEAAQTKSQGGLEKLLEQMMADG